MAASPLCGALGPVFNDTAERSFSHPCSSVHTHNFLEVRPPMWGAFTEASSWPSRTLSLTLFIVEGKVPVKDGKLLYADGRGAALVVRSLSLR